MIPLLLFSSHVVLAARPEESDEVSPNVAMTGTSDWGTQGSLRVSNARILNVDDGPHAASCKNWSEQAVQCYGSQGVPGVAEWCPKYCATQKPEVPPSDLKPADPTNYPDIEQTEVPLPNPADTTNSSDSKQPEVPPSDLKPADPTNSSDSKQPEVPPILEPVDTTNSSDSKQCIKYQVVEGDTLWEIKKKTGCEYVGNTFIEGGCTDELAGDKIKTDQLLWFGGGKCNANSSDSKQPEVPPSNLKPADLNVDGPQVFLGYYANWHENNLDRQAHLLTHITYSFAMVGSENYKGGPYSIRPFGEVEEGGTYKGYKELNQLKEKHQHLRTLIALGGWSFNDPSAKEAMKAVGKTWVDDGWTEYVFSDMVSTEENRQKFIVSVMEFCRQHGFDGVDLDWEYPGDTKRGGRKTDKENFAKLLTELRTEIEKETGYPEKLLLTLAVGVDGGNKKRIETAYDVTAINDAVDFVNIMTYDLYGSWGINSGAVVHSQLHGKEMNQLSAAKSMVEYEEAGLSKRKMTLGLAAYGRGWMMTGNDLVKMKPDQWKITATPGHAAYHEIEILKSKNFQEVYDQDTCGAHMHIQNSEGNYWIGYDSEDSMVCKAKYVIDQGLLGGFIWSIGEDDLSKGNPLLTKFSQSLGVPASKSD